MGLPQPLSGATFGDVDGSRGHFVGSRVEAAPDCSPIESPSLAVQRRQDGADQTVHVGAAQPTHTRPETHDGQVVPDDPGPAVGWPLTVQEQQAKTESPGLGDLGMLFSWQGDTSTCNDAAASCGIRRAPKQSTCSSDPAAAQAAGAPVEGDLPRH